MEVIGETVVGPQCVASNGDLDKLAERAEKQTMFKSLRNCSEEFSSVKQLEDEESTSSGEVEVDGKLGSRETCRIYRNPSDEFSSISSVQNFSVVKSLCSNDANGRDRDSLKICGQLMPEDAGGLSSTNDFSFSPCLPSSSSNEHSSALRYSSSLNAVYGNSSQSLSTGGLVPSPALATVNYSLSSNSQDPLPCAFQKDNKVTLLSACEPSMKLPSSHSIGHGHSPISDGASPLAGNKMHLQHFGFITSPISHLARDHQGTLNDIIPKGMRIEDIREVARVRNKTYYPTQRYSEEASIVREKLIRAMQKQFFPSQSILQKNLSKNHGEESLLERSSSIEVLSPLPNGTTLEHFSAVRDQNSFGVISKSSPSLRPLKNGGISEKLTGSTVSSAKSCRNHGNSATSTFSAFPRLLQYPDAIPPPPPKDPSTSRSSNWGGNGWCWKAKKKSWVWHPFVYCPYFYNPDNKQGISGLHVYRNRQVRLYETLVNCTQRGFVHEGVRVVELLDHSHPIRFATPVDEKAYSVCYVGEKIPSNHKERVIFGEYSGLITAAHIPDDQHQYVFSLRFNRDCFKNTDTVLQRIDNSSCDESWASDVADSPGKKVKSSQEGKLRASEIVAYLAAVDSNASKSMFDEGRQTHSLLPCTQSEEKPCIVSGEESTRISLSHSDMLASPVTASSKYSTLPCGSETDSCVKGSCDTQIVCSPSKKMATPSFGDISSPSHSTQHPLVNNACADQVRSRLSSSSIAFRSTQYPTSSPISGPTKGFQAVKPRFSAISPSSHSPLPANQRADLASRSSSPPSEASLQDSSSTPTLVDAQNDGKVMKYDKVVHAMIGDSTLVTTANSTNPSHTLIKDPSCLSRTSPLSKPSPTPPLSSNPSHLPTPSSSKSLANSSTFLTSLVEIPGNNTFTVNSGQEFNEMSMVNHYECVSIFNNRKKSVNTEWQIVYIDAWPHIILTSIPGIEIKPGDELLADFGWDWFERIDLECTKWMRKRLLVDRCNTLNLQLPDDSVDIVDVEGMTCDQLCGICASADEKNEEFREGGIVCDGCNRAFHLHCIDRVTDRPQSDEDWFCPFCILASERVCRSQLSLGKPLPSHRRLVEIWNDLQASDFMESHSAHTQQLEDDIPEPLESVAFTKICGYRPHSGSGKERPSCRSAGNVLTPKLPVGEIDAETRRGIVSSNRKLLPPECSSMLLPCRRCYRSYGKDADPEICRIHKLHLEPNFSDPDVFKVTDTPVDLVHSVVESLIRSIRVYQRQLANFEKSSASVESTSLTQVPLAIGSPHPNSPLPKKGSGALPSLRGGKKRKFSSDKFFSFVEYWSEMNNSANVSSPIVDAGVRNHTHVPEACVDSAHRNSDDDACLSGETPRSPPSQEVEDDCSSAAACTHQIRPNAANSADVLIVDSSKSKVNNSGSLNAFSMPSSVGGLDHPFLKKQKTKRFTEKWLQLQMLQLQKFAMMKGTAEEEKKYAGNDLENKQQAVYCTGPKVENLNDTISSTDREISGNNSLKMPAEAVFSEEVAVASNSTVSDCLVGSDSAENRDGKVGSLGKVITQEEHERGFKQVEDGKNCEGIFDSISCSSASSEVRGKLTEEIKGQGKTVFEIIGTSTI